MMRDAQIEAIKTYLYLKIGCRNQPLWALFYNGVVTSPDNISLTAVERIVLENNVPALAIMEYAMLETKPKKPLAPELVNIIKSAPETIDYEKVFKRLFYNVSYPDYLFSLPMGAGKTFLMAAFIYLDLYFAQQEPDNPIFAHNFMIMAPSGLKSSIIPSLKNIQRFDPSWILPEPAASQIKKLVKFELLDEQKSAKKSNRTKNPNAQKINMHLSSEGENLMGLVAVTNAEKVILDRLDKAEDQTLLSKEELNKMKVANELRHIIGEIPHLAIFVDEVHHAADNEIKLRQVVANWAESQNFNCMLGFSGTPYLEKAEKVCMTDTISVSNTDLTNVVYHYPLIDGIGNFLKYPDIRTADSDSDTIIRNGKIIRREYDVIPAQIFHLVTGYLIITAGLSCSGDVSAKHRPIFGFLAEKHIFLPAPHRYAGNIRPIIRKQTEYSVTIVLIYGNISLHGTLEKNKEIMTV